MAIRRRLRPSSHPLTRREGRHRRGLTPAVEAMEDRTALSSVLFASDRRGRLFTIDVPTGGVAVRGTMTRPMLDLAFDPAGALYGVDARSSLYRIDPATAATTRVGRVGAALNALVFAPDGTLYGAGSGLYRIDPATGAGTRVGGLGRLRSAGDLAFDGAGSLFLSTTTNRLARVDRATGSAVAVGPIGSRDVFGLAFGPDGILYGLSDRTSQVVAIDPGTGRGTTVSRFGGLGVSGAFGSSFREEAVTPSLAIDDATIREGDEGTTAAVFTVRLSSAVGRPVAVSYATVAGTATEGVDYRPTSGTLMFAPGQTTATIAVPVVGDTAPEGDESFAVALTDPMNATLARARGVGTIEDDDAALSINSVSRAEGDRGTAALTFTVTLAGPSRRPVTLQYATADGTATVADGDYLATGGTLTFAPGETTKAIAVQVVGDLKVEPDEAFTVVLSRPVNARLVAAQGVGTIRNDDILIP